MYNLNWSVNTSAQIDAQPYGVTKTVIIPVSSSNAIQQTVTVTGSAFSALSTGQLTNVVGISIYNDNSTYSSSVVIIATGSTGGNIISTIQPGQVAAIPWSASLNGLYASATTGNTASLQYYLQQS
jgi:hypothetical protein